MSQRELRRVQVRRRQLDRARTALAAAILAASQSGESIRDIARYAGLSRSRVHELLQEAKAEQERGT